LEPKIKEILQKLDILLAEYEEKKLSNIDISIADFEKWEIYSKNLDEIH
jgi:hypothetical protein